MSVCVCNVFGWDVEVDSLFFAGAGFAAECGKDEQVLYHTLNSVSISA